MIHLTGDIPYCLSYDKLVSLAEEQLAEHSLSACCTLISLDFDNFNYINDLFGYTVGDEVLCQFAEHLNKFIKQGECFCHLHADQYVLWLHEEDQASISTRIEQIMDAKESLLNILPIHYSLVCSCGIVRASLTDESFSGLLDKANFARKRAKGNYKSSVLFYDQHMADEMQWRKTLTFMMDAALKKNEFEMYLQPKVIIKTGQITGAEALVRWNSRTFGMIAPDRFIPIMEQNGFIRQLDFFMLNQACKYLKRSMDEGGTVLPISVNFSKAHIRDANFVEKVFQTVNQYGVSTKCIEIEITENMFTNDFQALIDVATSLKCLGFRVSLDDFGSAYSSLNCLKDLPLDVIKIDKSFLNETTDTDRGRTIIAKVVELIKSLRMVSVMEGIEESDQVEFLKKLSCDMGQGYYYARPMPVKEYTEFLKSHTSVSDLQITSEAPADKSHLYTIPQEFQLDNWELYTLGKNIDIGLMKGYLDGEATIQYINERALEYLGYSRQEFREVFNNRIVAFTHPDDIPSVRNNVEQLVKTGKPLKFQTRAIRKDGKIITLEGRASCVIDSQGRPVGLYAFQDVTEELERAENYQHSLEDKISKLEQAVEALRISEERYRLVMEQSDDIMFEWDFATDQISLSNNYQKFFNRAPICNQFSTNPDIRAFIHPDDLITFEKWVSDTFHKPNRVQTEFRLKTGDGGYLWLRGRSTAICDAEGTPIKEVGVFTNIEAQKKEMPV